MRPSDLDAVRWREIDAVFDAVLDTPPAEREGVLDQACRGDPELRREVEALLRAQGRDTGLLEEPVSALAAAILSGREPEAREGDQVGPFRVIREVGRGGMGVVFEAEDTRLGRHVALKVLRPSPDSGGEIEARFMSEARAVSALDHPNVATLYEIGTTSGGQRYMVFAHYEGETLDARIARGPLPPPDAVEIAARIAAGLSAAHRRGVVHRDVKPSNVLLTEGGEVKLLDFGVSELVGQESDRAAVRGTAAYMSPEQLDGAPVDSSSDLWSLGVVLYEMLAGQRPFRGDDTASILTAIRAARPPPPPDSLEGREALRAVIDRLLSRAPDERYPSADVLYEVLTTLGVARLAVLPPGASADTSTEHIVRGVHAALASELARLPGLEVLPPAAGQRFRDSGASCGAVARALDVDAVLEGTVLVDGDALDVTTRLVGAKGGTLWQDTFRRTIGDVPRMTATVARAIAGAMSVRLTPESEARLAAEREVDPEAYDAYLRGVFNMERRNAAGYALAERFLRRALEIDPEYAPAYAALAEAYGSAAFFGLRAPALTLPRVRELVDRALAIDPELPAALVTRAAVGLYGSWDWSGAEKDARRAIAANPSRAEAYRILSETLAVQGRYAEAVSAVEPLTRLDRGTQLSVFRPAVVRYYMGDFGRAIAIARDGLEFFPHFWQGRWILSLSLVGIGETEAGILECQRTVTDSNRTPMALGALGFAQARLGDVDAARAVLAELESRARDEYVAASFTAMIHVGLERFDEAFDDLERAYSERDLTLIHLRDHVHFGALRPDPRFQDLLNRVGIPRIP